MSRTLYVSAVHWLLGEEETLMGYPGKLDVRSHAVIAYTDFLSSAYVDSSTTRP